MAASPIRLAVDAVVFGYSKKDGVSVLLIRRKYEPFINSWALPGGFVLPEETLEDAVHRELEEETGIRVNYLEQLYTFGDPDRDPRRRIVSVAYFGLVKSSRYQQLRAATDAEDVQWFPIGSLPRLAFDHQQIIRLATERVRSKLRYQPIGFELLNFAKKVHALGILEEAEGLARPEGKGRPGKLYRFVKTRYQQLQKEGISFEI
jgi:8-oxo-dGTP diphosphatase